MAAKLSLPYLESNAGGEDA